MANEPRIIVKPFGVNDVVSVGRGNSAWHTSPVSVPSGDGSSILRYSGTQITEAEAMRALGLKYASGVAF